MSRIGSIPGAVTFTRAEGLKELAEKPAGRAAGSARAQEGARKAKSRGAPSPAPPGKPEKEWTVLLYLNGNNFLSNQVISTLRQMEFVGSDDKIDFVAQVSRRRGLLDRFSGDWSGTRRYHIQWNGKELTPVEMIKDFFTGWLPGRTRKIESPLVDDLGQVDMGDSQTLADFIKWGMRNYPARRYMVVMMGPSTGLSGMMGDEISGNQMKVPDVGEAFREVHQATGKKVDVLAINGSATNTAELAYELKDHVGYLVGSQGIQAGPGVPVAMILNEIKEAQELQPTDALTTARYWTLINSLAGGNPQFSSTVSALDLSKMDRVKETWNNLGQALLDAGVSGAKLRELLEGTQDFLGTSTNLAYQNSRDAYHFAQRVKEDREITDPAVKRAAQAAMDAIEGLTVGDAATGKYVQNAHGLSVFGPTHYGYFRPEGIPIPEDFSRRADYDKTAFARDTVWDEVLQRAARDSAFNRALKAVGFSEGAVDRLHAVKNQYDDTASFLLNWASFAGWFTAINAWFGQPAPGFLFLNPQQTIYAGLAGSAYDGYKAVRGIHQAATKLKDGDEVVYRGMDLVRAAAKATAISSYLVPTLQPWAATAGATMFFMPWIKDLYGVYDQYKEIRDGIELANQPRPLQVAEAARRHFGSKKLWDRPM